MTPEQRDALIDATVEACAKIAENFYQQVGSETVAVARRSLAVKFGTQIAAAIRKEFSHG